MMINPVSIRVLKMTSYLTGRYNLLNEALCVFARDFALGNMKSSTDSN